MKKPNVTPIKAIVALLILTLIVGGGNLLASWDEVHAYKTSEQRQGQLLEHRLCTTLSRLAALEPPPGPAAANPSRAYLQEEHATLAELGPDIGCDAPHAARLPTPKVAASPSFGVNALGITVYVPDQLGG